MTDKEYRNLVRFQKCTYLVRFQAIDAPRIWKCFQWDTQSSLTKLYPQIQFRKRAPASLLAVDFSNRAARAPGAWVPPTACIFHFLSSRVHMNKHINPISTFSESRCEGAVASVVGAAAKSFYFL